MKHSLTTAILFVAVFSLGAGIHPMQAQQRKNTTSPANLAGNQSGSISESKPSQRQRDMATMPLPDLVVDGPSVSLDPNNGYEQHTWTVKNIGDAEAHSTSLRIECEVLYTESTETMCRPASGTGNSLANAGDLEIPPLGKGSSYKAIYTAARIPPATKYRLSFTATVDPNNQVKELNKANNQKVVVLENSSIEKPSDAQKATLKNHVVPPESTPPRESAVAVASSQNQNSDLSRFAKPRLRLATEDPWNPIAPWTSNPTTNWIIANNDSAADAPATSVKISCLNMTNVELNEHNKEMFMARIGGFSQQQKDYLWARYQLAHPPLPTKCLFMQDRKEAIKALAKGKSSPVTELLMVQQGYRFQITLHLVGVEGNELVLKNY